MKKSGFAQLIGVKPRFSFIRYLLSDLRIFFNARR